MRGGISLREKAKLTLSTWNHMMIVNQVNKLHTLMQIIYMAGHESISEMVN